MSELRLATPKSECIRAFPPLAPWMATTWTSKSSTKLCKCTANDFALGQFEHAFQCIDGQRTFAPSKSHAWDAQLFEGETPATQI
ncbi:hypothetical protein K443DRAFT_310857 [Laccaria amethystina LaAM-08-1]|uniref:Uncharacterized protein n=1 Tax=Laccaria amethystina LaAM-08-1 TaxID=1095629 RepID=A0A0C9XEC9_9AGAR|nr:hypothetical protein K443DRAFT_310857 [Laccaria amethystina LaAM-08-1]